MQERIGINIPPPPPLRVVTIALSKLRGRHKHEKLNPTLLKTPKFPSIIFTIFFI